MAETAVAFVIEKLIDLLAEEVSQWTGLHREISGIKEELESIQSFLKDADTRAAAGRDMNNGVIKTWVKQVREAAFHIEDVIDQYSYMRNNMVKCSNQYTIIKLVHKIPHLFKKLRLYRHLNTEIQDIKLSVCEIRQRSERYGFKHSNCLVKGSSCWSDQNGKWNDDPRMGSLFIEEAELVGIESPRDDLIYWLLEGLSRSISVVAVVGMGGLGKTTLAKKVYDDHRIKEQFDCLAWISVSQSYNIEGLLRSALEQFCKARKESTPEGFHEADAKLLISMLREYMQPKRYMIVFDDIWETSFWGAIEHALPNNNRASRILITTRIKDVAYYCRRSSFVHVHELQPLPSDEAWELFLKKAFRFDCQGKCPHPLKNLSVEIVEKCGGLPLAIVSIGGLLSTKEKLVAEWQELLDGLSSEFESNPHLTGITRILSLSYEDLPHELKPCFLYFGIYPEGSSISCVKLVRQWIAEGFIRPRKGKTPEQVAQEYLTLLIHRSLVQVSSRFIDGKARKCRVHGLCHQIIRKEMENLSFCHVLSEDNPQVQGLTRRLSMGNCSSDAMENIKNSSIRSIFVLLADDQLPKQFIASLSKNFKLLKVLDFENSQVSHLPSDLGNLFHLRYLSLRNTKAQTLPKSIGKLVNLETLDLKKSQVYEIPSEITKLVKLRYLLACDYKYEEDFTFAFERGMKMQNSPGLGRLMALQKLYHLEANFGGLELIQELRNLRQLRKLGIKYLKTEQGKALCHSIEAMKQLESLELSSYSEDEMIDLRSISSPPKLLRRLYLKGRLERLPDWVSKLENLVKLRIFWSRLRDSPLKVLQGLQNLLELSLSYKGYDGETLCFEEGGFQKLRVLKLKHLENLSFLTIRKGSLPLLEVLHIGPAPKLKEIPNGIQYLRNLVFLQFVDMAQQLTIGLHPDNKGQSHWIVGHVPTVLLSYKHGPKCGVYKTYSLHDSMALVQPIWK